MSPDEILIVGAGPAGLAIAAQLRQAGLPFALIEQGAQLGTRWRQHYQRLHLHTHRRQSGLPGMAIARSAGRYPARNDFLDYLESYAQRFDINPQLEQTLHCLVPDAGGWRATTTAGTRVVRQVVLATGYNRVPNYPSWPGIDQLAVAPVHSADYQSATQTPGQRVLVVGMGNSGAEIAMDLCLAGREVTVAVRGNVNVVPRQIAGVPIATINRLAGLLPAHWNDWLTRKTLQSRYGDLPALGLAPLPYSAQCQMVEHQSVPLIDIGTIALIRQGRIKVKPQLTGSTHDTVTFADGSTAAFDQIITATGYRPRLDQLLGTGEVLDSEGTPPISGQALLPGLYLCGFRISPRGMLFEIGQEAVRIGQALQDAT